MMKLIIFVALCLIVMVHSVPTYNTMEISNRVARGNPENHALASLQNNAVHQRQKRHGGKFPHPPPQGFPQDPQQMQPAAIKTMQDGMQAAFNIPGGNNLPNMMNPIRG